MVPRVTSQKGPTSRIALSQLIVVVKAGEMSVYVQTWFDRAQSTDTGAATRCSDHQEEKVALWSHVCLSKGRTHMSRTLKSPFKTQCMQTALCLFIDA